MITIEEMKDYIAAKAEKVNKGDEEEQGLQEF
jgi:hypothetical protein